MPATMVQQIHQYEIHHRLGSGAGGVVFYATDTYLKRPVVIKMLHRSAADDEAMRGKLLEEAHMASAIEHPNVCSIYEVGEHEDQPFIAMQYVAGQTLQHLIEAKALNTRLALSIGIQIADGLAAAHKLGILHRDLKPSNAMITEGGLVKILDFGLARRKTPERDVAGTPSGRAPASASSRFGMVAYMAPEQFITRHSSEQSDLFALGVILYQMIADTHPFWIPNLSQAQLARIIQNRTPPRPRALHPDLPEALDEIIMKALEKQPANRYRYASEMRDALKTLMKSMHLEAGVVPGDVSAVLPSPMPEENGHGKASLLATWAERLLPSKPVKAPKNSIAVLPFRDLSTSSSDRYYGLALADAIATRLARLPSVTVRPPSALLSLSDQPLEALEAGRRLSAESVLTGTFSRNEDGFTLNWQFLDVASQAIRSGGTLGVPSLDLIAVQSHIADEVFAALRTSDELEMPTGSNTPQQASVSTTATELPEEVSEEYLEARAMLTRFALRASLRSDLDQARQQFEAVLERAPRFAPAHTGLGMAHLRYVWNGFGGDSHLLDAQHHLDQALALDPGDIEAKLHRTFTLLWRGEKERARHEIQYLLKTVPHDAEVHLGAGLGLMLDGLLEEALRLFGMALRLNPAVATQVYYYRARLHLYLGHLDLALQEIDRGLAHEPQHALLRTLLGYWLYRKGKLDDAIDTLKDVLAQHPHLRLAALTLALCYVEYDSWHSVRLRQCARPSVSSSRM